MANDVELEFYKKLMLEGTLNDAQREYFRSHAVGTITDPSTGATSLVGPDGKSLLVFDAATGDIISSVIMRTDTLATLLSETAAGDGEIAVATDQNALVVFKGSPSVPIVYRPSSEVAYSKCVVAYTNAPTVTAVTLDISATGLLDQAGVIDATNNAITGLLAGDRVEVDAELLILGDSGGTYRKLWLEHETSPGVWDVFGDGQEYSESVLDGFYRFTARVSMDAAENVRIRFQHNAGVNRSVSSASVAYITVKRPA